MEIYLKNLYIHAYGLLYQITHIIFNFKLLILSSDPRLQSVLNKVYMYFPLSQWRFNILNLSSID